MKLVWKVDVAPTGPYRSFQKRGWPDASYGKDGKPAVFLYSASDYTPHAARTGEHSPIEVVVLHHNDPKQPRSWGRYRLKQQATTLAEAKLLAKNWLEQHPDWHPKPDV